MSYFNALTKALENLYDKYNKKLLDIQVTSPNKLSF